MLYAMVGKQIYSRSSGAHMIVVASAVDILERNTGSRIVAIMAMRLQWHRYCELSNAIEVWQPHDAWNLTTSTVVLRRDHR